MNKIPSKRSKGEIQLAKFIQNLLPQTCIKTGTERGTPIPYELDIYIPVIGLAIEFNGRKFHNMREKKYPGHHFKKRNDCKNVNIHLLNIEHLTWKRGKIRCKRWLLDKIKQRIAASNIHVYVKEDIVPVRNVI